jgi:hypothetical protein
MLIRSQNKKCLINLNNVTRLTAGKIYGNDEKGWLIEVDKVPFSECLGQYSTETKAIKVLDMIQNEYLKHIYGQGGLMATSDAVFQPFAFIPPKVFRMPADDEVEG